MKRILIIESRAAYLMLLSSEAERIGLFVQTSFCAESGVQRFLKERIKHRDFDIISISSPLASHAFGVPQENSSIVVIDYLARKDYRGLVIHYMNTGTQIAKDNNFPFFLNETIVLPSHGFDQGSLKKWGSLCSEAHSQET